MADDNTTDKKTKSNGCCGLLHTAKKDLSSAPADDFAAWQSQKRSQADIDAQSAQQLQHLQTAIAQRDVPGAAQAKDRLAQLSEEQNALGAANASPALDSYNLGDLSKNFGAVLSAMPGGSRAPATGRGTASGAGGVGSSSAANAAGPKVAPAQAGGAGRAGGLYISTGRTKQIDVGCFTAGKKTKNKHVEYDRQLDGQQKGLNDMTVKEYLEGREHYAEIGRKGTGAAQQEARAKFQTKLTNDFEKQLNKQGVVGTEAVQKASGLATDRMKTLAALHNPDMFAGGKDVIGGMGDKGVNASIGAQWKGRAAQLDKEANSIPASERGSTKMNSKLRRCKDGEKPDLS
jgi:hypothetical protein